MPSSTTATVDDRARCCPIGAPNLRARNIAPSTIKSYLTVGEKLLALLHETGKPTSVAALTHDHLKGFLAHRADRVSPRPSPSTTAPCRRSSAG